jgi:hypothetical protein
LSATQCIENNKNNILALYLLVLPQHPPIHSLRGETEMKRLTLAIALGLALGAAQAEPLVPPYVV